MKISNLKQKIPSFLDDFPEMNLVYVFGSQVSGNIRPMSDIALAILYEPGDEKPSLEDRFQYAISCALKTGRVDERVQRYREAFRRTARTLGEIRTTQDKKPF